MLIYLDSSRLMNILERGKPIDSDALLSHLGSKHKLVLTGETIIELAGPLRYGGIKSGVMQLLNRLETLPLSFISLSDLRERELNNAIDAFASGAEYEEADPFVPRFDYTLTPSQPRTASFVALSLAETVWNLYQECPELFDHMNGLFSKLVTLTRANRELKKTPALKEHFRTVVRRSFTVNKLADDRLDYLADWIYEDPRRCPAFRLSFELYLAIRKNRNDLPQTGDLSDFMQVNVIPYVHVSCFDRRIRTYVAQVDQRLGLGYSLHVFSDPAEALAALR